MLAGDAVVRRDLELVLVPPLIVELVAVLEHDPRRPRLVVDQVDPERQLGMLLVDRVPAHSFICNTEKGIA